MQTASTKATTVQIRPARPDDAPGVRALFDRATPTARYLRFFSHSNTGPEREVRRIEQGGPLVAMVAVVEATGEIIGLATSDLDGDAAEIAVFVDDRWHRQGIASRLTTAVVRRGKDAGVTSVSARILWDNPAPLHMMRRAFPHLRVVPDHGEYILRGPIRSMAADGNKDEEGPASGPGQASAAA